MPRNSNCLSCLWYVCCKCCTAFVFVELWAFFKHVGIFTYYRCCWLLRSYSVGDEYVKCEYGTIRGILTGQVLGESSCRVPLSPPQIPHGLVWIRTWALTMRRRCHRPAETCHLCHFTPVCFLIWYRTNAESLSLSLSPHPNRASWYYRSFSYSPTDPLMSCLKKKVLKFTLNVN